MKDGMKMPRTLLEAVVYFSDERQAWKCFVNRRWPDGQVTCPRCGSEKTHLIESRMVWRCNGCTKQFSVKVGTIFEDSAVKLSKWLPALWLIANNKNGISSCELARALGVTQKTAWFMLHRIRLAMQTGTIEKMSGEVEVDETFIGGKSKNMHVDKRAEKISGRGYHDKTVVMGMLQRGGHIHTRIIPERHKGTMLPPILKNVKFGSSVFTDEHKTYKLLRFAFKHEVIDHSISYVEGRVHTNGLENYWSLLKRTLGGTYVSVEPFQLFRYLDEQAFRFNERHLDDAQRFGKVLSSAAGRRLTYNELTGKELVQPVNA